jgi:peptide/nickel transport system substrate-binding protein
MFAALTDAKRGRERTYKATCTILSVVALTLFFPIARTGSAIAAQVPQRGGILTFVVGSQPPSYDGHRETTFGTIHPIAPFYSTLLRVNPENPSSTTDFVGDLALEVPEPTHDGKTYIFNLRRNAKFWDGQPVTGNDVVASLNKIIFPPSGVISPRKGFYSMVDRVYAKDDYTVVVELKYPSSAFIPALANPYNFIYSAKKLAEDIHWYEKNILGSGPFIFVQHQPRAFVEGRRNPDYHHEGQPYLDGYRASFAVQQSRRVEAIREGEAMIEFRGFPPKSRDMLIRALGNQINVQESDWNCALLVTPNHLVKPFDNPRVRRALTLAVDRWSGSKLLARIAIVRAVGGIVFPAHPLAATKVELQEIAGYWPGLERSRAEARRLLGEAGVPEGFKFKFLIRGIDQPYKVVGTWLITQWHSVRLNAEEWVLPTKPWYEKLRSRSDAFDVSIDFNCNSVPNPLLDVSKYLSRDRTGDNYANYKDRVLDTLFDQMNRATDFPEQRGLMRQYEKRILHEQAHMLVTLWLYRIIPHRSVVRGWKIGPSHHMNQDLATVWLAR